MTDQQQQSDVVVPMHLTKRPAVDVLLQHHVLLEEAIQKDLARYFVPLQKEMVPHINELIRLVNVMANEIQGTEPSLETYAHITGILDFVRNIETLFAAYHAVFAGAVREVLIDRTAAGTEAT